VDRALTWGRRAALAVILFAAASALAGRLFPNEAVPNGSLPAPGGTPPALTPPDWVEQDLLPVNEWSRPGDKLSAVNGIVVHYVGNPNTTAQQNRSYYNNLASTHETYASSHFVIGMDGAVLQCVPLDEVAYCSNQRNSDTISIECCHPDSTGRFTDETYQALLRLTAWLKDAYGLAREDILRHYDVTGKGCPLWFVDHPEDWDAFLDAVDGLTGAPLPTVLSTAPAGGDVPWYLTLVNREHPLPDGWTVDTRALPNGLKFDQRAYDALTRMLAAGEAEGLRFVVCSAYRTVAYQQSLFDAQVDKYLRQGFSRSEAEAWTAQEIAVPGTSEHNLGLAADIVSRDYQLLDEGQSQTPEQQWLMAHCWEYGFILRYPEDKSELTGIIYEPWHYRYVGREAAAEITSRGLCLEEYYSELKLGNNII